MKLKSFKTENIAETQYQDKGFKGWGHGVGHSQTGVGSGTGKMRQPIGVYAVKKI